MRKGLQLTVLLAVICLALTACSSSGGTPSDASGGIVTEPSEPAANNEQEARNMYAELLPTQENIPDRRTIQSICKDLADGISGHITEIYYTWRK